jgi:hypothetical protein
MLTLPPYLHPSLVKTSLTYGSRVEKALANFPPLRSVRAQLRHTAPHIILQNLLSIYIYIDFGITHYHWYYEIIRLPTNLLIFSIFISCLLYLFFLRVDRVS